jgi:hypothetical protein
MTRGSRPLNRRSEYVWLMWLDGEGSVGGFLGSNGLRSDQKRIEMKSSIIQVEDLKVCGDDAKCDEMEY